MEWRDQGLLLSARKQGESGLLLTIFTPGQGLAKGWFRPTKKEVALCQIGALGEFTWRARLSQHLGKFQFEYHGNPCLIYMDDPLRLGALSSLLGLLSIVLPEGHPYLRIWEGVQDFFDHLESPDWIGRLIQVELLVLRELGFGLSLEKCASTGQQEDLIYVSPRTARAVSREAGAPYAEKLLPLPAFLVKNIEKEAPKADELLQGLGLTGYFLKHLILHQGGNELPPARQRFEKLYQECLRKRP